MRTNVALLACGCLLANLTLATTAAAQCEGIWREYQHPVLTIRHDTNVLMVNSSASGYGIVTGVPDEPEPGPATWSTLKVLSR